MYFQLFWCLLFAIICQVRCAEIEMFSSNFDTVPVNGNCEPNTVGFVSNTLAEQLGQQLDERLKNIVIIQNDQADDNIIKTFDWAIRKLCQLTAPNGDMRQMYVPQYFKIAKQVAQMCSNLQQNYSATKGVVMQQIYAAEARRISHEFGGYANMVKILDNVEHQIVAQLQKQEAVGQQDCIKERTSGAKLSMVLRNKLSEIATKFGNECLAQKLRMIIKAKKPSEQLELGYELLKGIAQQKNRHVAHRHHVRRTKRDDNLEQAIGAVVGGIAVGLAIMTGVIFVIKNWEAFLYLAIFAVLFVFFFKILQPRP